MYYVPSFNNNNCVVLVNNEVLRVYQTRPTNNSSVNYTDYYYRSHYYSNSGTATFSSYTTLPTCIANNKITTNYLYRQDLDSIMIIFMSIIVLCYFLAFKPISRLFGRWLKI